MTEGDITRLNRMYKCPDFKEEDLNAIDDSIVEDEIESENNDHLEDSPDDSPDDNESSNKMVKYLKGVTKSLIYIINPLCSFQKKLKMILKQFGNV